MNFKHELSPSKPLLHSTQSLILGLEHLLSFRCTGGGPHSPGDTTAQEQPHPRVI